MKKWKKTKKKQNKMNPRYGWKYDIPTQKKNKEKAK